MSLSGVYNILATPFDRQKQVDLGSLRRLVNFQLDKDVYGLTILGVLGEAAKLSVDERKLVMETVFETVAGRVPIVVGTSHADLATCIALSKAAFVAGAAGVMIAPPRMDKPTDAEVIGLYAASPSRLSSPLSCRISPP